MEYFNEMEVVFDSRSENEGFARVAVAAFMTQMDPVLEEVADVKTAVSEAVTNSIIHGYEGRTSGKITVWCGIEKDKKTILVTVQGSGHRYRKRGAGDGATLYDQAGYGSVRDGICIYGSIYG